MLVDSFRRLLRDSCPSIIIISHQERIMELADVLVVVAEGRVKELGAREEIFPRIMGELTPACGLTPPGNDYVQRRVLHG